MYEMGWNVAFRHVVLHICYWIKIIHYDSKLNCFISIFFWNLYNGYVLNRNKRVPYTSSENNFMHKLLAFSCISYWPFHASPKIWKTASRSQKKANNHVSCKNAKAKSCVIKIQILSKFRKTYRTLHFDASKCRVWHIVTD